MNKLTPEDLLNNLSNFYGSENFYRHLYARGCYTDGVQYLAENAGAYWLIDAIFSHAEFNTKPGYEDFQVWTLNVFDNQATLNIKGDDEETVLVQTIPWTDFSLPSIELWKIKSEFGYTLLLPSEY